MKKSLLFVLILSFVLGTSKATIITIKVSDFQFKPKTVNAVVGDTIQWQWKNGIHNTVSLTIPSGAPAWNAAMDSAHKKFKYILQVSGVYKYQCTFHFTVMKGTINVSPSLAAGLNSFAISDYNAEALLNWKTASSKEVSYFSVQKSDDGEHFSEIAKLKPTAANTFSTADKTPSSSKYVYYQIDMVDTKGNHQLSPIQMYVNNKVAASKLVTSLSPNPLTKPGHLMLQFNADKDGEMLVKLYSQNGNFIKQAKMNATKGINNGHFHIGEMAPGAYYIVCTLGNITEKHTVIMK